MRIDVGIALQYSEATLFRVSCEMVLPAFRSIPKSVDSSPELPEKVPLWVVLLLRPHADDPESHGHAHHNEKLQKRRNCHRSKERIQVLYVLEASSEAKSPPHLKTPPSADPSREESSAPRSSSLATDDEGVSAATSKPRMMPISVFLPARSFSSGDSANIH